MCSPFPLATGSWGDSHALGASDPLAATCCDHADPATRPAAGPRAHQWCRGVFVSAGFVVCGCCFVLKPASRLARSAASMLCIGAARRDSGSWPLPLLQDPVVMQAMARVVVRSELGIEEIDLVWGERVSVNTRGAAEVLVEAGSDASISLDRRSLDPFRRAGHGVVTATLKPALVVGARRLEVREGRRAAWSISQLKRHSRSERSSVRWSRSLNPTCRGSVARSGTSTTSADSSGQLARLASRRS